MHKKRDRIAFLLACLSVGLFVAGGYLLLRQFIIPPRTEYTAPPAATATPVPAVATPRPEETPTAPEPTPYDLTPVKIYFPDYEQVCEILPVGKIDPETGEEVGEFEKGSMATIDSPVIAAWYKYNPSPGQPGNAVIAGHRSVDGENGVFSILHSIQINEEIVIEMSDGSFLRYYVHAADIFPVEEIPDWVMAPDWESDVSCLTLITCQGRFRDHHSVNRAVARCYPYPAET